MKRSLALSCVVVLAALLSSRTEAESPQAAARHERARILRGQPSSPVDETTCSVRALSLPTGTPTGLACRDARRIVSEVKRKLAAGPRTPQPKAFADSLTGWLDPHGLWSAAPDSPVRHRIRQEAAALLAELEASPRSGDTCHGALRLAASVQSWVNTLRTHYQSARTSTVTAREAFALASDPIYEDDPVRRPATRLAMELGRRAKAFSEHHAGTKTALVAEARFLPQLPVAQWQQVVLSAAVRAYVPLVDPHGQWAPLDEEWSLYAGDSTLSGDPRLWTRMLRTALGVRVLEGAPPPVQDGDLLLEIAGTPTVGLSVEQLEQLSRLESVGGETTRAVAVWREGEAAVRRLQVEIEEPEANASFGRPFDAERVRYGAGSVGVLTIGDVPDGLGEDVAEWLREARSEPEPLLGVVLDLRGNGGGSIDGALSTIGVFLPGVASFPLRRRDGGIEVHRASTPSLDGRWDGPVATIVDGYTASAAEMIAGAVSVYGRGPVVGAKTFGKGCIQEYFDDRSGVGVLQLTTMVFALPNGGVLQGVGIQPDMSLELPGARGGEASLLAALPGWKGPDVRSVSPPGPAWPPAAGRLGPCAEPAVCRALSRLSSANTARRALRGSSSIAARRTSP